jgi:prepilin-type N-terminal cleavage/methylation domain-containing protein
MTSPRRVPLRNAVRRDHASPSRPDAGFTLIEILIVVVILGVIMVPLGNAVIGFLKNTDVASDRLALSHDAQISAAYFARDVASLGIRDYTAVPSAGGTVPFKQSVQIDAAYDAGGQTCGASGTTAKVRFLSDHWHNSGPTPTVTTDIIAYYLAVNGGVTALHRMKCSGTAVPLSDVVIAHSVDVAASVNVICSSTCDAAAVPQQVTLSFSVTKPSIGAYPIRLNGQRRQT